MSVITVSRGTMSGGKLIAENLAEQLGFRCIDRDIIVEKAAASGISHEVLRNALDKPPTMLERFQHKKYVYLALIQAALTDEVRTSRAVYHGNAGHLLLRGGGPVFRVRIIAPMEFRISMARQRLKLHEDEATAYIQKMDDSRRKWAHYLYGVDWTDPSLYDLVVNMENVGALDAADTIAYMVKKQACFSFDAKCQASMADLAIASRVKADLAVNGATGHFEFEVTASDGVVSIDGKLSDIKRVEDIKSIALAVPGVKDVDLSQLTSRIPA